MSDSATSPTLLTKLLPFLSLITEGKLAQVIRNILDSLTLAERLRDRLSYHVTYEILDYNATLDIRDAVGEETTITRREVIRFLQDNVVAIHDHAWGDGDIFAEYRCRPGSCSLSDKRFRMLRQTQARFYCSNSTDKLNRQMTFRAACAIM